MISEHHDSELSLELQSLARCALSSWKLVLKKKESIGQIFTKT